MSGPVGAVMERPPSLQPVIGPAMLALAGFLLQAMAAGSIERLGLTADGAASLVLQLVAGIGAWLGLAWAAARLFDLLLRRAALVTRRATPYPRLLSDMVRAVLFAAAAATIAASVFGQPALGLVATS